MKCYYRVSIKALLRERGKEEFVVLRNSKGEYELPGGGIEHGESIVESLVREIYEELNLVVSIDDRSIQPIFFDVYKARSHSVWVAFMIYDIIVPKLDNDLKKITLQAVMESPENIYVPYLSKLAAGALQ